MKLEVKRKWFTDRSICGNFYIDGQYEYFSLEPPWMDGANIHKKSAILPGTYEMIIDYSEHFKRDMPHILGVPGRDKVRIHIINTAKDTEGCTGIGYTHAEDFIGQSRAAFDNFFPKLKEALQTGKVYITFTNEDINARI